MLKTQKSAYTKAKNNKKFTLIISNFSQISDNHLQPLLRTQKSVIFKNYRTAYEEQYRPHTNIIKQKSPRFMKKIAAV
ncbi:hypothetical protein DCAR_0312480 [Daucus carota subsp. sativus]|uniref:Uncharacterized protein n=1 Tax=Daucus carota subsp. sativus TaxID=79200 RepID=A0A166B1N2_DAUCS|nr:hypothetical protein DCAR_0312480 [Daucus carota subsp. sativus]